MFDLFDQNSWIRHRLFVSRHEHAQFYSKFLFWPEPGNTKGGKYHCTVDLLFDWFGLVCFANKNKKM